MCKFNDNIFNSNMIHRVLVASQFIQNSKETRK